MPRVSLSKFSQPIFTAVGSAAYLQNMRKLDAYVAVGKAFSLLSFTSAKSELELIRFGGADASDIAHLQCLLSPNNERSGVIVGRVDGSVELWEDRQPKSAAVVYKESKGAVESGLPPRPVVDFPSHSFVATAMEKCGAIGIWQLQTGELVNILECPAWIGLFLSLYVHPVDERHIATLTNIRNMIDLCVKDTVTRMPCRSAKDGPPPALETSSFPQIPSPAYRSLPRFSVLVDSSRRQSRALIVRREAALQAGIVGCTPPSHGLCQTEKAKGLAYCDMCA
ncbi:hypothetical protein EmuJ_000141600 [Echinococcus multilocularis]|uniref:Uncharacterized protein n=1 Tax=Echinococcus multilocularis TaxID=6211 RepID=A0A087VZ51_ECHMU|nr:hypothetical protein EmuJ_000141600 [Echinococcus multilocularis]